MERRRHTVAVQQSTGGVPYKVHAVLAPSHVSLPAFLLLSLPLRAERMLLSMIVFVPLAMWVRKDRRPPDEDRPA